MAVQSKFFQVTGQVLLEYKTDQYAITRNSTGKPCKYLVYEGVDNNQYCILNDNIKHGLYLKDDNFTEYYGGIDSSIEIANNNTKYPYGHNIYVNNTDYQIGRLIQDTNNEEEREDSIYCDTIRLYLLTGYIMNNIAGYSLKVKGKVIKVTGEDEYANTIVNRIDDYIYLLNWYISKEELKDNIHWLESPLYLNSKFYDRYIEIKLPSAQDIAINNRNIDYIYKYINDNNETYYLRGKVDRFSNIIIEFATAQFNNIILENQYDTRGPQDIILDAKKEMSIFPESNANNIGVNLYEDDTTHSIIYYPTFGDGNQIEPINLDIMWKIDTGEIPLISYSEYDSANDGMDEFIEMYGDNEGDIPCKWIIINELTVTYVYDKIYHIDDPNNTKSETYTDFYTNTIDYSYRKPDDGDFYISKFVPYIKERTNMNCKSIIIQYNCHLYNRMNNTDIVRSASMTIKDPYKYILTQIDTTNVINYKIVNKIDKSEFKISNPAQIQSKPQIIREYYDVTELIVGVNDDIANVYAQGRMTLRLHRTGSNYQLRLYTLNADNTRTAFDLTGPWKYKLIFPSINGGNIEILPNMDNAKTNFSLGSLSFYISADNAKQIMTVPMSERYFALIIDNGGIDVNSTIYEGKVEWVA